MSRQLQRFSHELPSLPLRAPWIELAPHPCCPPPSFSLVQCAGMGWLVLPLNGSMPEDLFVAQQAARQQTPELRRGL